MLCTLAFHWENNTLRGNLHSWANWGIFPFGGYGKRLSWQQVICGTSGDLHLLEIKNAQAMEHQFWWYSTLFWLWKAENGKKIYLLGLCNESYNARIFAQKWCGNFGIYFEPGFSFESEIFKLEQIHAKYFGNSGHAVNLWRIPPFCLPRETPRKCCGVFLWLKVSFQMLKESSILQFRFAFCVDVYKPCNFYTSMQGWRAFLLGNLWIKDRLERAWMNWLIKLTRCHHCALQTYFHALGICSWVIFIDPNPRPVASSLYQHLCNVFPRTKFSRPDINVLFCVEPSVVAVAFFPFLWRKGNKKICDVNFKGKAVTLKCQCSGRTFDLLLFCFFEFLTATLFWFVNVAFLLFRQPSGLFWNRIRNVKCWRGRHFLLKVHLSWIEETNSSWNVAVAIRPLNSDEFQFVTGVKGPYPG